MVPLPRPLGLGGRVPHKITCLKALDKKSYLFRVTSKNLTTKSSLAADLMTENPAGGPCHVKPNDLHKGGNDNRHNYNHTSRPALSAIGRGLGLRRGRVLIKHKRVVAGDRYRNGGRGARTPALDVLRLSGLWIVLQAISFPAERPQRSLR